MAAYRLPGALPRGVGRRPEPAVRSGARAPALQRVPRHARVRGPGRLRRRRRERAPPERLRHDAVAQHHGGGGPPPPPPPHETGAGATRPPPPPPPPPPPGRLGAPRSPM